MKTHILRLLLGTIMLSVLSWLMPGIVVIFWLFKSYIALAAVIYVIGAIFLKGLDKAVSRSYNKHD